MILRRISREEHVDRLGLHNRPTQLLAEGCGINDQVLVNLKGGTEHSLLVVGELVPMLNRTVVGNDVLSELLGPDALLLGQLQ